MQVDMLADMLLVVRVELVGILVVLPDVVADRLVLVVVHRAVQVDCILVSGRQSDEDMQEHQDIVDFVVHQVKEHQDTELLD